VILAQIGLPHGARQRPGRGDALVADGSPTGYDARIVIALAELPGAVASATWEVFVLASPYILVGLAAAGLLHGLLPAARVARWLGRPGLGSMARGAILGIPLPLCSCAVVPVTLELSRKGASREASLAFLVSTPETGVDSMLLTWGLMGPVMTVARPLAALATSLVAAVSSRLAGSEASRADPSPEPPAGGEPPDPPRPGLRRGLRYGFRSMVDEIGFWLVLGLVLTGLITALVPDNLIREVIGRGPGALVVMLFLGVPLYMCASASTPIAAALMFKGLSPGAALVFLLAGPATNASSLVLIARFFGRRFLAIYLGSVAATALASGLALDLLVARAGWSLLPRLAAGEDPESRAVGLAAAAALILLLAASFARGSWRAALREVVGDLRQWRRLLGRELDAGVGPAEDHCAARLPYRGRRHARRVPGEPALALRGVSCRYPGERRLALTGIDLDAPAGSRIAIVGPNGAGKSTLLKVIAGLLPAVGGDIRLYGQPEAAFHHRVAYLPQRGDLDWGFPLSVSRLVLTGRYVHLGWLQGPSPADERIVDRVVARLRLEPLADRLVGQLSGGQQQRALLGRALAQEADLLLLDEPLTAVDAETRAVMAEVLDELRQKGTTVLVATHDIGRREGEFDDALFLSEGRIVPTPAGPGSG
jgi:ABC-type Mn2+/Zn2+ transport system ATPase subunit/uncharacterized membrane protein YraQ (UPF0718 family)